MPLLTVPPPTTGVPGYVAPPPPFTWDPGITDIYNQLVNAGMSPFTAWSTAPQVFYGVMPMEVALAQAATYGAAGGGGIALPDPAVYLGLLQNLGFTNLGDLQGLVQRARSNRWGATEFLYYLRQTQAYKDRFPGIFGRNGQLLMSEEQYLAYESAYRALSQNFGYKMTQEDVGTWISKGVDPTELQQRFDVIQRADQYRPALQQLKATLARRGLAGKGKITLAEARDFILGIADPKWYKVYEEFSGRTAAVQAGFDIVKGTDAFGYTTLTRKQILDIIHRVPGIQSEGDLAASFQQLAQQFRELIPEGTITGFDVSKKDLIQLEFGGPRQARIAERVKRIIASVQARQQPMAQPQFVATGQGPQLFGLETQRRAQVQ